MCLTATVLILTLFSSGSSIAQQAPVPPTNGSAGKQTDGRAIAPAATYKVYTRRVVVDVVVTGSDGKPVSGLNRSDFSVFEDNQPQAITSFEAHTATLPPTRTIPALPAMPPGVYINFPAAPPSDSVNVLLLDALNTPIKDQAYVRQEMVRYLKTVPPGMRIAIFTLASQLRIVQGFTDDSSVLLAALNDKKHKLLPEQSSLMNSQQVDDQLQSQINDVASLSANPQLSQVVASMQQFNADLESFQYDMRVRLTLDALADIARYLSSVPGRKNLIWFSGSFPLNINADSDLSDPFEAMRNYSEEVKQTTDLLSASQVAVYPIDARGLMTIPMYDASNSGSKYSSNPAAFNKDLIRFSDRTAAEHASMNQIAEETGGHAIYNSNDLKGALGAVMQNGANFYTLVYEPSNNKWDGQFRHIKIRLARSGYTLQYRRGYYADNPDDPADYAASGTTQDQFFSLMAHGLPDFSQIIYKVQVRPAKSQSSAGPEFAGQAKQLKAPITRYAIEYAALMKELSLQTLPNGLHHGVLRFAVVAFDRDGKELNANSQQIELNLRPATYVAYQQIGLQYTQQLDVPADAVYLRTGIYDPSTGKIGTYEIPLASLTKNAAPSARP